MPDTALTSQEVERQLDPAHLARRRATRADKAQTVLGPVPPEKLGATLMHEHLLADASHLEPTADDTKTLARRDAAMSPEMASYIKYGGQPNLDNARLDDPEDAIVELAAFREAGGSTLVEVTSLGLNRDAAGLRAISERAGVNIIMGGSYYVGASHPEDMALRDEEAIAAAIVRDVLDGVDGTGVCTGIIGEVGCSWPLEEMEKKVLRASAHAQALTGAPLSIHPGRHEDAPMEIADVLAAAGADLRRTIMCHLERTIFTRATMKRFAETGCALEFDLFGHENSFYWPAPHLAMPNDAQRLDWLAWLIEQGFGDQIIVSHDNDNKIFLTRFGGPGYAHLLVNIAPRMKLWGIEEGAVDAMFVATPARLLTFAAENRSAPDPTRG